jgi:hypothetical protein
MTKEQVIVKVQDSLGSLFTKDDVVNCLNLVEKQSTDSDNLIQRIKDGLTKVMDEIDFNDSNNFEITDCEFSINRSNEVELDSFEVYANQLKDLVRAEIRDFLSTLREEIQEEQENVLQHSESN